MTCFLYIDAYPRVRLTWGALCDQENTVIWEDSGRQHHMEVEVLIVRPLWRARRGKQGCRRVEGAWGKREQGRGDLLRCCTSWEEGKEQTDCSKKSTQRVSTWKHLARLFPKREAMHALWDGLVQETLGLTEDFPRTALLAASVCFISDYSVPRTPGLTQVMKRYAWDYLCVHRDYGTSEGRGPELHRDMHNLIRLAIELHG